MQLVATSRTSFSLGAIIALLVLILAIVLAVVGGVTSFVLLCLIGALALAVLIG